MGSLMQNDTADVRAAVAGLESLHTDRSEESAEVLLHLLEASNAELGEWVKSQEEDATTRVKSETSDAKHKGKQRAASVVAGGQLAVEQVQSAADDSLELYGGRAKESAEAARVLSVKLRGGVANASE